MIDVYAGAIILWPLNRIPLGWHLCDGSLLNINEYQLLYVLLGKNTEVMALQILLYQI